MEALCIRGFKPHCCWLQSENRSHSSLTRSSVKSLTLQARRCSIWGSQQHRESCSSSPSTKLIRFNSFRAQRVPGFARAFSDVPEFNSCCGDRRCLLPCARHGPRQGCLKFGTKRRRHSTCSASVTDEVTSPRSSGFSFGEGIIQDVQRKLPFYMSDFQDGLHPKAVAAAFFLAFACLAPCIAFGGLTATLTGGAIGVVETIVATAASGVVYALLAGQPLTLLGPTGLVVVFTGLLYKVTTQMGLPFLPVYAWVGLWSSAYLLILAAIQASDLIRLFTRFTDETFSALISFGFIYEASKSILHLFSSSSPIATDGALLSLQLAIGTCTLALAFSALRTSRLLLRPIRETLADFGPPLAIVIASCIPPLFFSHVALPSLMLPTSAAVTTSGRPWLVPIWGVLPTSVVLLCSVPAALITLLIFLDQNITTRLLNSPEYPLRKGEGFHLDLAVLGLLMAACSLFGMPWMVASTVPSLSHVRSLATTSQSISIDGGNAERPEEQVVRIQENRLTGMAIHTAVGASLLLLPLLRLVPLPVTDGVFLYMGLTSVAGNQFVERLRLWITDPELYPTHNFIEQVPRVALHSFTAIQLSCLSALWTLKRSKWGILFPLLILALMPFRNLIIARIFRPQDLAILDAH